MWGLTLILIIFSMMGITASMLLSQISKWLLATQDRDETRAYLLYIAYQQRTQVFDDWDELENKK